MRRNEHGQTSERKRKLPRTISHRSEAPRSIIRSRSAVAKEYRQIRNEESRRYVSERNKTLPKSLNGSTYGYEGDFDSDDSFYLSRQDTDSDLEYYDEDELDEDENEDEDEEESNFSMRERYIADDDWDTEYETEQLNRARRLR